MSAITPSSDLYLLKCPLEMDNLHQLNFTNATAQFNYFNSLPKKLNIDEDDYSYIRQDSVLRIGAHIDSLLEYNYVMYRNENYSNKWFYAFITDMEYLNDGCTAVTIKTDVWQTWQFDLTFRKCFVEREHVNDDTFGLHTIPENLEVGEYICNTTFDADYAKHDSAAAVENLVVVFQTTKVAFNNYTFPTNTSQVYAGIPQGCYMFGITYKEALETGRLNFIVGMYDANGAADAIVSIFVVPKGVCEWETKNAKGSGDTYLVPVSSSSCEVISNFQTAFNDTLDGYTPKNNKCLTGQFNYLYVSNNGGVDVTYNYENFIGNTCKFIIYGTLEQGGAVKLSPYNSKVSKRDGEYTSWTEGVEGVKLPMLSWASDFYLNWEAVNAKNIEVQTAFMGAEFGLNIASGLASFAAGDPTGGGSAGIGVGGLASGLANTLQQVKQAKMTPPQARGNVNGGGLTFAANRACFTFKKMSIRREYAEIVDQYFSQVGYKVNTVKVPNLTGRRNWNYVKTIDVNILADIPQADLNEIKGFFNRGITIWHNPTTFLDYNQNNDIV